MIIISHRVNTIAELKQTPVQYGVEVDLRDHDGAIVLQHDPFKGGESFEEYLQYYQHRFIVLNVKCEGIEERTLQLVAQRGISDCFLLDLSFPALIGLVRKGERRVAVRYSEFEPIEGCLALAGKVNWVWLDCFTQYPARPALWDKVLKEFRICLVAPELQGRACPETEDMWALEDLYQMSAVCTKFPNSWASASRHD